MMNRIWTIVAAVTLFAASAHAEDGKVIASIKPLHSLVAAIMEGSGDAPVLLVTGSASPHEFALRPSQRRALEHADVVFYMGDSFELFLDKTLAALPASVERAPMENAPGITLYRLRLAHGFEADDDDVPGAHDLHLWMSPANAKAMAGEIVRTLSALYPQNRTLYAANAIKLDEKIDALDARLQRRLAPLADKPVIVFHDAFQYFEKSYGLNVAGSITINPDRPPGAKRVRALREKIVQAGVVCVFREPSFDGHVVASLLGGTKARSGVLDPEGALLSPGPELYFQLMDGIARNLEDCLGS
ncbi:MAG: zinc ABC transporter substrate-binding protein [Pseudomonadota bacterium]|nr:zinc ABC transporter substrate-binding protein [Pseudomonadota bacterium]MDE3037746.1 zinc ABC transporter substrate-binding protein [Pseudomonadota bacterium]